MDQGSTDTPKMWLSCQACIGHNPGLKYARTHQNRCCLCCRIFIRVVSVSMQCRITVMVSHSLLAPRFTLSESGVDPSTAIDIGGFSGLNQTFRVLRFRKPKNNGQLLKTRKIFDTFRDNFRQIMLLFLVGSQYSTLMNHFPVIDTIHYTSFRTKDTQNR